jgi:hypothetical protein
LLRHLLGTVCDPAFLSLPRLYLCSVRSDAVVQPSAAGNRNVLQNGPAHARPSQRTLEDGERIPLSCFALAGVACARVPQLDLSIHMESESIRPDFGSGFLQRSWLSPNWEPPKSPPGGCPVDDYLGCFKDNGDGVQHPNTLTFLAHAWPLCPCRSERSGRRCRSLSSCRRLWTAVVFLQPGLALIVRCARASSGCEACRENVRGIRVFRHTSTVGSYRAVFGVRLLIMMNIEAYLTSITFPDDTFTSRPPRVGPV